jgi:hypothetical protein
MKCLLSYGITQMSLDEDPRAVVRELADAIAGGSGVVGSNHRLTGLVALARLGATAGALREFVAGAARGDPAPDDAGGDGDAPPVTDANWRDLRGLAERIGALRDYFLAAHTAAAAAATVRGVVPSDAAFDAASVAVVRAYVPPLLEGMQAHIFHGVIDLAYSIEARCAAGIASVRVDMTHARTHTHTHRHKHTHSHTQTRARTHTQTHTHTHIRYTNTAATTTTPVCAAVSVLTRACALRLQALAYWTYCFQSFAPGGVGDAAGDESVLQLLPCEAAWVAAGVHCAAAALERIPDALEARRVGGGAPLPRRTRDQRTAIYGILAGLGGGGGKDSVAVAVAGGDDECMSRDELRVAARGILLAGWSMYARTQSNHFMLLHCATGAYSLVKILHMLTRVDCVRAMMHYAAGVVLLSFLSQSLPLVPAPTAVPLLSWGELVSSAAATRDVHTMKLVAAGAELAGALPTHPLLVLPDGLDLGDLPRIAAAQRLAARLAAVAAAAAGAAAVAATPADVV